MKDKTSNFLKKIVSVISSAAKAKSMAIKSKTDAVRARLIVFSLLKDKRFSLDGISHKIHAILGQQEKKSHEGDVSTDLDHSKAIVVCNANESYSGSVHQTHELILVENTEGSYYQYHDDDNGEKYPDLTHSLFGGNDDDEDLGDPNASAIDMVRDSKEEGEKFSLEDEIDQVADLFIKKFHKRMRMQKLESFKRYQDMLERST